METMEQAASKKDFNLLGRTKAAEVYWISAALFSRSALKELLSFKDRKLSIAKLLVALIVSLVGNNNIYNIT